MTNPIPFPPYQYPKAALTRPDLVNYLLRLKAEGHAIYTKEDGYVIVLEGGPIDIWPLGDRWRVGFTKLGILSTFGDTSTQQELEESLSHAAMQAGQSWPFRPTSGRLSAVTPATNLRTISDLIGSSKVEAVFDPYLDNGSLAVLIDILSFGSGSVSNDVRILGSTKKTQGTIPQFSRAGFTAWLTELGINGEARVVPAKDEHRRFMLLSGGRSLILGLSLNAIHKNEAVRVESDIKDRPFFDSVWVTASPL